MFIQGALANVNKEVSQDELLNYLNTNIPSADFFKLQPPPGAIMAAALDWRGVLHDAAAIATLGTVLWGAYTNFIQPIHKRDPNSNSGIFIQIKNSDGEFDQFMIGKDIKDKQVLIHRLEHTVKKLRINTCPELPKQEIEEINHSEYWIKIE